MPKNITSVTWSATDLPAALSINSSSGVISGTPTVQPGLYYPKVKVITNYGEDEKQITIKVAIPESWKPVIDPNQQIEATADEAITPYQVTGQNVKIGS